MRIRQRYGPAGTWVFELSNDCAHADRPSLDGLIAVLARVAAELEQRQLLAPRCVELQQWLTRKGDRRPPEPDIEVAVVDAAGIVAACRPVLDELEQKRGFREPAHVRVRGIGIALDASGRPRDEADLLWLEGVSVVSHYIEVSTQSDVWMTHDFLARPQLDVAKRNAPRLEQALRAIETLLHVSCDASEHTRFAVPIGYTLTNHKGGRDEVNAINDPGRYLEPESSP